jgi:hypothetical protein
MTCGVASHLVSEFVVCCSSCETGTYSECDFSSNSRTSKDGLQMIGRRKSENRAREREEQGKVRCQAFLPPSNKCDLLDRWSKRWDEADGSYVLCRHNSLVAKVAL